NLLERTAEVEVGAAESTGGLAVAEVERTEERVEAEVDAPRLDPAGRVAGREGSAELPRFDRDAGVGALEQGLTHELLVIEKPPELHAIAHQRAGTEARAAEESAPREKIVVGKRVAARVAADDPAEQERVVPERARIVAPGEPLRVDVLRAERGARREELRFE